MRKNPEYFDAKHAEGCKDYYGVKVVAYFYVGDRIVEGEPFGDTEETAYVDDMGFEWQKGHMLAKSPGGDNKLHNLLPMKEEVNNSTFKKVESSVHTLFENLTNIQKLCNVGPLHIKYTVERVLKSIQNVKGHKFPGCFRYSIEVLNNEENVIDSALFMKALKSLGLAINVKFTDTLSVG